MSRLGVALEQGRVAAVSLHRGRVTWAAEAPWTDAGDLAAILAALASERPRHAREASVLLGPDVARVKTVEGLPRLSRVELAAHVGLHSKRYFLQNGIPLVTDAMPATAGNGATGRAIMAGAPVPIVEALIEGLDAAGLRCRTLGPAELTADSSAVDESLTPLLRLAVRAATAPPSALLLLPQSAIQRRRREQARHFWRWLAAAAGAVAVAGFTWAWGQRLQERAHLRELARLAPAAEAALAVRSDLDDATAALAAVASFGGSGRATGRFLSELARVLPDSAFLVTLRLEADGSGLVSGFAPRAAGIVPRLEQSGLVSGARIDGAVVREVIGGRELERFTIRFVAGRREP